MQLDRSIDDDLQMIYILFLLQTMHVLMDMERAGIRILYGSRQTKAMQAKAARKLAQMPGAGLCLHNN
jgi:hypothetical protein